MLRHRDPDCVGEWTLLTSQGRPARSDVWNRDDVAQARAGYGLACSTCGATTAGNLHPGDFRSAKTEELAGFLLTCLADEGT